MNDILERLKATTKINGAYPRDIADAIKEIEWLRQEVASLLAEKGKLKQLVLLSILLLVNVTLQYHAS